MIIMDSDQVSYVDKRYHSLLDIIQLTFGILDIFEEMLHPNITLDHIYVASIGKQTDSVILVTDHLSPSPISTTFGVFKSLSAL